MRWHAVIPAAGQSKRFSDGSTRKQYIELAGKPLLFHTINLLVTSDIFARIFVVVEPGQETYVRQEIINRFDRECGDKLQLVAGGESRGHSVYNGLVAAAGCDFMAIHDGARPCLSVSLLRKLVETTEQCDAVVPGYPVKDTIKEYDATAGQIIKTADRQKFWAVQTPQCFRYEIVKKAYETAMATGVVDTDDAALVEKLGVPVKILESDACNIKVTYTADVAAATAFIERQHV